MICLFPSGDTLRLALTSGLVPTSVAESLARGHWDAEGRVWVESDKSLPADARRELAHLDVQFPRSATRPFDLVVAGWLQLLPLTRQHPVREVGDKTPILFELNADCAEVVNEILRLGNDRQGFRWAQCGDDSKMFLRVLGPPYYTLLRALDREGGAGAPIAYREAQPRVWVQLGYEHPLENEIRPADGNVLLLRSPHDWRSICDGPYRDIYEVLEFSFAGAVSLTAVERQDRWKVPLRLASGGSGEVPELYVLRDNAVEQIDSLIQHSDDQLIARLAFAVGERDGRTVVVLRVRPSKNAPPVLVLDGLGYRSYLRLSQLFMPVGKRLHPPLRRDVVAKLLAGDGKQITWLQPMDGGVFQPESLPDSAFRPLSEWVEYVLDRESAPLKEWVAVHRFEFESFVCNEETKPQKPPPKDPTRKPRPEVVPKTAREKEVVKSRPTEIKIDSPVEPMRLDPSELEQKLRTIEKEFLEDTSPLESEERQAAWSTMADFNGELGHHEAAAICRGHALWESHEPAIAAMRHWLSLETANDKRAEKQSMPLEMLERIVLRALPAASDLRRLVLVLSVLAAEHIDAGPALIGKALRYLEKHESKLGVRSMWLAWTALHRLSHGDVLTLAKARDRVLERLYDHGLSPDLDLPNFLRFTGTRAGERFRLIQEHLQRLRPLMTKWADDGFINIPGTRVYVDLMFAYGLTRLGESSEGRTIAENAANHLATRDDVHFWLIDAFQHRIQRAALGTADRERLPAELLERLELANKLSRYKIDRMREHSRILEPTEKIDPYRAWHGHYADELSRMLAAIYDINDRDLLAKKFQELLPASSKAKRPWGAQAEPRILATAIELAPRLGDQFAEDLLFRLRRVLPTVEKPNERLFLLEKGLFLAGHYDKVDEVSLLIEHVHDLLVQDQNTLTAAELESMMGPTVRGLRRLGLRDHVARLLEATQNTPQLQAAHQPGSQQANAMRLQLQIASGWFYFGQEPKGRRILDDARALLLEARLSSVEQTALACAYVASLSQAPLEVMLARLMEFFRKVKGVTDTFTTSTHFSLSRLDVIEAVIMTLVHDDVTVEPQIRRWLDDDEFLVRRRIHRDVHEAMEKAGLS